MARAGGSERGRRRAANVAASSRGHGGNRRFKSRQFAAERFARVPRADDLRAASAAASTGRIILTKNCGLWTTATRGVLPPLRNNATRMPGLLRSDRLTQVEHDSEQQDAHHGECEQRCEDENFQEALHGSRLIAPSKTVPSHQSDPNGRRFPPERF